MIASTLHSLRSASGAAPHPQPKVPDRLRSACQEMEGLFLSQLLSAMRKTVGEESSFLDSGFAHGLFQEMFDQQVAVQAARRGGVGLAEALYRQLTLSAKVPPQNCR